MTAATIVLDDDPTGTQAVADVPVLLEWGPERLARALARRPSAVYLLTNTRAYDAERAEALTGAAARAALAASPASRVVLRGDSTLRGHLIEEYRALRDALGGPREPVLLLAPALPAAGRITRDGIHRLRRDDRWLPLHETEYAVDGGFAYGSAHLLEWAEERSAGALPARNGVTVGLDRLRAAGSAAVTDALLAAWSAGRPAVVAPDAETIDDLRIVACGLDAAERAGARVIVRCAPAFVGALVGNLATGLVPAPAIDGGALVVCGSHVPSTTRQLEHLCAREGIGVVELDPMALATPGHLASAAVRDAAAAASDAIERTGVAVVATARARPEATRNLESGMAIARGIAAVVPAIRPPLGVVIAKGGITSAVTLQHGIGAAEAWVEGPLLDGVSLWRAEGPRGPLAYVVVPGNVGADRLLSDLLRRLGCL